MKANVKTAVMLVGGAGLRLRPLTEDIPKCMISLQGKPLLYWTLSWLKQYGFKHVVLGVAYREEVIRKFVKENPMDLEIDFSKHTVEGETGEGFRLAIQRYVSDDDFLAMNGDELTNLNLEKFAEFHLRQKPIATIAVSPMNSPFGILEIAGDDIVGFNEKPVLEDKLVSTGIYMFNHRILDYLPMRESMEKTTFPILAKNKRLKAYRLGKSERWLTINSIKDLSIAEREFGNIRRR